MMGSEDSKFLKMFSSSLSYVFMNTTHGFNAYSLMTILNGLGRLVLWLAM